MKKSVLDSALKQASRELCVNYRTVEEIYRSYWKFIHDTISDLPLRTEELDNIDSLTTNFNIPFIGKLYTNKDRILKYKNQLNYYNHVRNQKDKTNRLSSTGD